MSLVAVGSARAAPGATTLALALAAAWPEPRQPMIWEADADGGVLAARYRLGDRPGLVTASAAARRGELAGDGLWEHTQRLPGGAPVIVGGESAAEAHAALNAAGGELARLLRERPDVDTIADVGRLSPSSPATRVAETADVVLVASRPVLEELRHAAYRLHALTAAGAAAAGLALVGPGHYDAASVSDDLGVTVLAEIPADPRAAGALTHGGRLKALRRSTLIRAARGLAEELRARAAGPAVPDDASPQAVGGGAAPEAEAT